MKGFRRSVRSPAKRGAGNPTCSGAGRRRCVARHPAQETRCARSTSAGAARPAPTPSWRRGGARRALSPARHPRQPRGAWLRGHRPCHRSPTEREASPGYHGSYSVKPVCQTSGDRGHSRISGLGQFQIRDRSRPPRGRRLDHLVAVNRSRPWRAASGGEIVVIRLRRSIRKVVTPAATDTLAR